MSTRPRVSMDSSTAAICQTPGWRSAWTRPWCTSSPSWGTTWSSGHSDLESKLSLVWIGWGLKSFVNFVLWKSILESFYRLNFSRTLTLSIVLYLWTIKCKTERVHFSPSPFMLLSSVKIALTSIKISVWSVTGWDWTYFRKKISTDVESSIRQNVCLLKYFNPKMISVERLLWYYADACTSVNQPQKILKSQKQHLRK